MKDQPIGKTSPASVREKSRDCQDEQEESTLSDVRTSAENSQPSTESMSSLRKYHIIISAQPQFIEEQSDPEEPRYVFAYRITLHNDGEMAVQLISRHWIVADAQGNEQEICGIGVVGEQPVLEPGEIYEYTSYCSLETSIGSMHGNYLMEAADGTHFEAEIPEFHLIGPHILH